jgi:hypothetical protein
MELIGRFKRPMRLPTRRFPQRFRLKSLENGLSFGDNRVVASEQSLMRMRMGLGKIRMQDARCRGEASSFNSFPAFRTLNPASFLSGMA